MHRNYAVFWQSAAWPYTRRWNCIFSDGLILNTNTYSVGNLDKKQSMTLNGILVRDAMPRKSEHHILYMFLFYLFILFFMENNACVTILLPPNLHMSF